MKEKEDEEEEEEKKKRKGKRAVERHRIVERIIASNPIH